MGIAYADESMRTSNGESMYLLGATLFTNDDQSLDDLVRLKAKGAAKLHWRELGRKTQVDVMKILSDIPTLTTVVVGAPMNPRKQKRTRQLVDAIKSKQKGLAFSIRHKRGFEDAKLWVPDQILGAYGDQLCLTELDDDWLRAWHSLEPQTRFEAIDL